VRRLPDWEIVTGAALGIVTFRYAPADRTETEIDSLNQAIVDAMIAGGFALVTSTVIRGRNVLRLCTINPRTSENDIRETVRRLDALGRGRAGAVPQDAAIGGTDS
jgi:glutamate/tyrosine decarboxylase-like PLP-dependent enzyme